MEYGGFASLHEAAWNYQNNQVAAFNHLEDARMSYEKGLRKPGSVLVHTLHQGLRVPWAWQGHWAILALECLTVADELGQYHHWYKRANLWKPGIEKTRWKDLASTPMEDHWSSYISGVGSSGQPQAAILRASTGTWTVFRPCRPVDPESQGQNYRLQ